MNKYAKESLSNDPFSLEGTNSFTFQDGTFNPDFVSQTEQTSYVFEDGTLRQDNKVDLKTIKDQLDEYVLKLQKEDLQLRKEKARLSKKEERIETIAYMLKRFGDYLFGTADNKFFSSVIGSGFFLSSLFSFLDHVDIQNIITAIIGGILVCNPTIHPIHEKILERRKIYHPEYDFEQERFSTKWKKKKEKDLANSREAYRQAYCQQEKNWEKYHEVEKRYLELAEKEHTKEVTIEEIQKQKDQEQETLVKKQALLEAQLNNILEQLAKFQNAHPSDKRIDIPEEYLFVPVEDHYEIDPRYRDFLPLINLESFTFQNVDVSGIDFGNCNASFDPQVVYQKNMSGGVYLIGPSFPVFKDVRLDDATIIAPDLMPQTVSIHLNDLANYNENTTFIRCNVYDEKEQLIKMERSSYSPTKQKTILR